MTFGTPTARGRRRCETVTNKSYSDYGGRGIRVCEEWKTFDGFYADMGAGYKRGLTLDRIDVNGNYCKDNCRWVSKLVQANNTRTNRHVEADGESLTVAEFCRKYNYDYDLVRYRIRIGETLEEAVRPAHEEIEYNGVVKTVIDFAKENGLTYHQLKKRLMRGWSVERAITQPLRPRRSVAQ